MSDMWAGEQCEPCTSQVNASFIWGTRVFHPSGRPCLHAEPVEPEPVSNEPSAEVIRRFAQAQQGISR